METNTMIRRPLIQDLVKEAMEGTVSKVNISAEAMRQYGFSIPDGGEQTKTAAVETPDVLDGEFVEKMASALEYVADELKKEGANPGSPDNASPGVGPGQGPSALEVLTAKASEENIGPGEGGKATDKSQQPKNPGLSSVPGQKADPANALETNDSAMHGEQPVEPIPNEKASIKAASAELLAKNLERFGLGKQAAASLSNLGKAAIPKGSDADKDGKKGEGDKPGFWGSKKGLATGAAALGGAALLARKGGKDLGKRVAQQFSKKASANSELLAKNLSRFGLEKQAEDAINPANISGGAAPATGAEAPPGVSEAEKGPAPAEPSDVTGQKGLIASNDAAINYTRRDAKADPKKDLGALLTEPAQSKATDKVLHRVWDKTDQAGAKIAGDLTRTAAAQALLAKLASAGKSQPKTAASSCSAEDSVRAAVASKTKGKGKESMLNPGLSTPAGQTGQDTTGVSGA